MPVLLVRIWKWKRLHASPGYKMALQSARLLSKIDHLSGLLLPGAHERVNRYPCPKSESVIDWVLSCSFIGLPQHTASSEGGTANSFTLAG
mgnify:CR=1 FL=1